MPLGEAIAVNGRGEIHLAHQASGADTPGNELWDLSDPR